MYVCIISLKVSKENFPGNFTSICSLNIKHGTGKINEVGELKIPRTLPHFKPVSYTHLTLPTILRV